MTDSILNPSTASNVQSATNVSPFEPSGSSKNEFLKRFTGHKLRKNAKAKIAKLLEYADTLILKTQSMGMDDCFRSNEPVTMDKSEFWDWYEKNYSDMVILLTIREGALVKVQVCDCIYHFSNDVVMTFSLDGEEAQSTIIEGECSEVEGTEEVKEPVQLAPFDQYEHLGKDRRGEADRDRMEWSETSLVITDGNAYTLEEYNDKAMSEDAMEAGRDNGYAKTMV